MINYYEPKLDLTLLGCGFLGSYHLGAIYLLKQIWPAKPYERICGASCGGLLGVLLVAGVQLDLVLDNAINIMRQLRRFFKSPLQVKYLSIIKLVEQNLEKVLPPDAHKRCTNKLGLSVTRVDWLVPQAMPIKLTNLMISEFHSRRDLIALTCAGCFIPIWSGLATVYQFRQASYVDGAYSDNKPRFPDAPPSGYQVELSPFSGDTEVSPRDKFHLFKMNVMGTHYMVNWSNVVRTTHAMLPFRLDLYRRYLVGGHRDMKEFLFRKNLIKCSECHYALTKSCRPEQPSACLFCLRLLERVDSLKMSAKFIELLSD